jgi:hypothetical protein
MVIRSLSCSGGSDSLSKGAVAVLLSLIRRRLLRTLCWQIVFLQVGEALDRNVGGRIICEYYRVDPFEHRQVDLAQERLGKLGLQIERLGTTSTSCPPHAFAEVRLWNGKGLY